MGVMMYLERLAEIVLCIIFVSILLWDRFIRIDEPRHCLHTVDTFPEDYFSMREPLPIVSQCTYATIFFGSVNTNERYLNVLFCPGMVETNILKSDKETEPPVVVVVVVTTSQPLLQQLKAWCDTVTTPKVMLMDCNFKKDPTQVVKMIERAKWVVKVRGGKVVVVWSGVTPILQELNSLSDVGSEVAVEVLSVGESAKPLWHPALIHHLAKGGGTLRWL